MQRGGFLWDATLINGPLRKGKTWCTSLGRQSINFLGSRIKRQAEQGDEGTGGSSGYPEFDNSLLGTFLVKLDEMDSPAFRITKQGTEDEEEEAGGQADPPDRDGGGGEGGHVWWARLVVAVAGLAFLAAVVGLVVVCVARQCAESRAAVAKAQVHSGVPQQAHVAHYYTGHRPSYAGELQQHLAPANRVAPAEATAATTTTTTVLMDVSVPGPATYRPPPGAPGGAPHIRIVSPAPSPAAGPASPDWLQKQQH